MKEQELLQRLARAVERDVPDALPGILLRAQEQKGTHMNLTTISPAMPERQTKPARTWIRWVAGAAAVLALAAGLFTGYRFTAVDSVVGFDVNPSIELSVNRMEQVLKVTPLNGDALHVLDGMNLKNVDLDVAVNALIGSMLKQGYVDQLKNSILITVSSGDPQKGAQLQERLSNEVSSLLEANSISGAVLSQTVAEDQRLEALAQQHNISLGKASLVDSVVAQDARLSYVDIAALPINDINLLLDSKQAKVEGVSSSGKASSGAYLGEGKAQDIALAQAGLSRSAVTLIKTRLDFEDGRMVYEVEFYNAEGKYEYEVDALTGKILSQEIDQKRTHDTTPPQSSGSRSSAGQNSGSSAAGIDEESAKTIAVNHAGLSSSDVSFSKVHRDHEHGKAVYDLEFYCDGIKYEYEIDMATGKVVSHSSEHQGDSGHDSHSGHTVPAPSSNVTNWIGEAKAKSIALAHAGLAESAVYKLEVEMDREGDRLVYTVEFSSGSIEYEYEIEAFTGEILKYDTEQDH